jgi:hypothetical protein
VAYYVGALQLDGCGLPRQVPPMPLAGERILGMNGEQLGAAVERAGHEYGVMSQMFHEAAKEVADVGTLAERVHGQLVELIDQVLMTQISGETRKTEGSFTIADQRIEVEAGRSGVAVAYLVDSSGTRLLSYVFRPGDESAHAILEALGVENVRAHDAAELDEYLRSLAA